MCGGCGGRGGVWFAALMMAVCPGCLEEVRVDPDSARHDDPPCLGLTDTHTDTLTDRHTDTLTYRHTDTLTDRHTDRHAAQEHQLTPSIIKNTARCTVNRKSTHSLRDTHSVTDTLIDTHCHTHCHIH